MGGFAGCHPHNLGDRCPHLPGPLLLPPSWRKQRRGWVKQLQWHLHVWNFTNSHLFYFPKAAAQTYLDAHTQNSLWYLNYCRKHQRVTTAVAHWHHFQWHCWHSLRHLQPHVCTHALIGEAGHTLFVISIMRSSDSSSTGLIFSMCMFICANYDCVKCA